MLSVSASEYHENFARQATPKQRNHLSNAILLVYIKAIHAESKGEYGWPRVLKELRKRGIRVGKERVRTLMALHGIKARAKRKYKATTDSNHSLPIAPNLLDRQFSVSQPDQVWTSDITYLATDEGWVYLAVVIDLFSRQVVGWSMQHMKKDLGMRCVWRGSDVTRRLGSSSIRIAVANTVAMNFRGCWLWHACFDESQR